MILIIPSLCCACDLKQTVEYRFASEIYELSLGADHPETVKCLNNVLEKKRLGQLSNMLCDKLNLKTR